MAVKPALIHSHNADASVAAAPPVPRPHEGAQVLSVVNRKEVFGEIPLHLSVEIGREVLQLFGNQGILYAPIGASALGVSVTVPEAYLQSRPTSNLYEVQVHQDDTLPAMAALSRGGWTLGNIEDYFSMVFRDAQGITHKVKTVQDQALFFKSTGNGTLYVMTMFLPTEYYRVRNNKIQVLPFLEIQTPGETIAHKMLRAAVRDKRDMVQVSLANDLRILLGENGVALIRETIGQSADARQRFTSLVDNVVSGLSRYGADTRTVDNITTLLELRRMH